MTELHIRTLPKLAGGSASNDPSVMVRRSRDLVPHTGNALIQWIPYGARQLTRVGRIGAMGWALLVCSLIIVVAVDLPQRSESQTLREQLASMQAGSDASRSQHEVREIVGQLPQRAELPRILQQMIRQSELAGVELESGRYEQLSEAGGIARFRFSFPVKGSYPSINRFVNGTLASIPAAGVDTMRIERKSVGEGTVEADLRFVVFVRNTP